MRRIFGQLKFAYGAGAMQIAGFTDDAGVFVMMAGIRSRVRVKHFNSMHEYHY
jgi:hypothetical protein